MKKKYFFTVDEWAKQMHFSPDYVRRQIREGKIAAFKAGRTWRILADQTKKARVTWTSLTSGKKFPVPPISPDGLIWDVKKNRYVLIEKYAKEHGYRIVTKNGKRMIYIMSNPEFRAALDRQDKELMQQGQLVTLENGEQVYLIDLGKVKHYSSKPDTEQK